ncbi:hypothetical protein DAPPUDRAFT_334394 [Daphnia pulex]|uniref:Uncharacterized protein n=1 Tax=Daphnia pulex TaxID=6669 RepID=E9HVH9_DAPPU|nr:hypothetical protein DAPPUDRAFT_334394 [Daphnia pulex]|eukprot:EFX64250.1 hypothetical protein DAPPUDRAFT_334394 [Daphnia pulex]
MIEKVNQVKSDLKLEQEISSRIPAESSFTVFEFNIIHIGTAKFRTGAIIGIPANYNYKSSTTPADKRNIVLRATLYTLLGGIMFTTWMFIKDFTTYRWEEDAEEAASGISEEYAKDALEFYRKILQ